MKNRISNNEVPAERFASTQTALILVACMLFSVFLSLAFFFSQSLRLDEAQSLWQTAHTIPGILSVVAQDVHVPLYHLILHFWQIAFGNGVPAARLLSLIFFLASIPALYALGRIAFNEKTGVYATLIYVLSGFMQWYANEARMYSLLALAAVINQIFFVLIWKSGEEKRPLVWLGYFVSALVGIYTHYFFWFILAAEAAFYFMYRRIFPPKSFRNFVITAAILLLCITPWLLYVRSLGSASNTRPDIPPPSSVDIFNTFSNFMFGFQADAINTVILSSWPILMLLGFLALQKNKKVPPQTMYFIVALILPILLAFIVSYTFRPIYLSRYFTGTFPALSLVIAWFLSAYPRGVSAAVKTILGLGMAAMLGIEIANPWTPVKENYRAAAEYVSAQSTARDVFVVSAPFTIYPVEYYYRGEATLATIPDWNRLLVGPIPTFKPNELPQDAARIADYQKLYLLLSYDQGYEEKERVYFDTHFERVAAKDFSKGLTLYTYKLRYTSENLRADLARLSTPAAPNAGVSAPSSTAVEALTRQ